MEPEAHQPSVAEHATLQRLASPKKFAQLSAAEHEARLRYDVDTVLALQLSSWSDRAWAPVAEALAEYGYGVIAGWTFTGKVFGEVKRIGKGVRPCPASWLDEEAVCSLADETVALAIRKFKQVLMDGAWQPARGASLATYFVGQCKFQFPNVYRSWLAAEQRRREQPVHHNTDWITREDPEVIATRSGSADGILEQMPQLEALIYRLKFLEGYSYAEIAEMVDEVPNAKAAENRVTRERARWVDRKRAG